MKKLLTGIVVLALANMAFAVPSFQINGGNTIVLTPGVPLVVPVTVTEQVAGVAGMTLNVETQSPFQIADLRIDKDAGGVAIAGLAFATNSSGANIFTQANGTPPEAAQGDVTTASGTLVWTSNTVALVTLLAPIGIDPKATGTLSTANGVYEMGDSVLRAATGDPMQGIGQSTVGIVVPEPVSALLLLAGLPLIRRRRA